MRKKGMMTAAAAMVMAAAMSMTSIAAGWQKDDNGWRYGTNADNSTWYMGSWQWIDGNGDGIAESYFFDQNGYLLVNTTTADGFTVNADGAWVLNGVVQTKLMAGPGGGSETTGGVGGSPSGGGGSSSSGGGSSSGTNSSSLTEEERAVGGMYGIPDAWLGSYCEVSVLEDGSLKTVGWTDYTDPITGFAAHTGYREWTQKGGNTVTVITFTDDNTMSCVETIPPDMVNRFFLLRK